MAPAVSRLKRRSEFLRVAGSGIRCAMPGVVVQMGRRPAVEGGAEGVRYGLTASRRVGNAVARNRVRRRLRAIAERVLALHGEAGCDYVLIGRAATLTRPHAALVADVERAIRRLGGASPAARGRGTGARQRGR